MVRLIPLVCRNFFGDSHVLKPIMLPGKIVIFSFKNILTQLMKEALEKDGFTYATLSIATSERDRTKALSDFLYDPRTTVCLADQR